MNQNSAQIREQIHRDINRANMRRMKTAEAAEWLRLHATGRALECLEIILADYQREDLENTSDFQRYCQERELTEARASLACMTGA